MPLDLPQPVADYFAADTGDSTAFVRCFTEQAVVQDEGRTYTGQAAIRQWKADSSQRYTYTSTPLACEVDGGTTVVTSRLTGNFPGSPVDLRYVFGVEGVRIASLEIKP